MISVRTSAERGHSDLGWLDSHHTFSFGSYADPRFMGFQALRVLNDDRVAPGKGFGAHGHRDMEIISYVLDGALAHQDSMGERRELGPNEAQAMSAGTGVIHSEFNPSRTDPVHFLQIWIIPDTEDLQPSYQQFAYDPAEKRGKLRLIAGPDRETTPRSAFIHQDARMYAAVLRPGETIEYELPSGRHSWVHCAVGSVTLNGVSLNEGDGAAVSAESRVTVSGAGAAGGELLLFDLA
jgi:redox-sensitive bicupin YhaK (pirin superfamily)